MFKEYDISFYGKRYKEKPTGREIGEISRKLTANRLSYDFIAKRVGENGCVFDPIFYYGTCNSDIFVAYLLFVFFFDRVQIYFFFFTGWIIKLNLKHPLIILERTLNFILIFAMFYENLFKIFLADKF